MKSKPFFFYLLIYSQFLLSSSFADDELVFFQEGNVPILITAPHAGPPGTFLPGVSPRKGKGVEKFITSWDIGTGDIANQVSLGFQKLSKKTPYVVIAWFNRMYCDANRPAKWAYEDEKAKPYYDKYHGHILSSLKEMIKKYDFAILIEIHGQSKSPNSIYRGTRNGKTVKRLIEKKGPSAVTGPNSFFGQMALMGYSIIPADEKTSEDLYNGGYSVAYYSSLTGVSGIQMEIGRALRSKKKKRVTLSEDMSTALDRFYEAYLK